MNKLLSVTVQRARPVWSARRTWRAAAVGGVAVAIALGTAPAASAMADAAATRSGRPLRGLDISAYQHVGVPINWRVLARHGIGFVAIKVTEGTYYTNRYYRSDARAAAKAGLAVLPYVFANPSQSDGAATARFAVRVARYRRGSELPLVVDLENDPYGGSDCYGLGTRRMVGWIAGFIARARALTGRRSVIYTTAAWWHECTGSTGRFRSDPLWLAAYGVAWPAAPSPWRRWAFWQYSNNGFLPGIGLTDLDYYQPVSGLSSLRPAPRHKKVRQKHRKPSKHRKPKPKI
jgi:GH25 family lysozyme M1 (1,4-beta-N-acetylmuramidase)